MDLHCRAARRASFIRQSNFARRRARAEIKHRVKWWIATVIDDSERDIVSALHEGSGRRRCDRQSDEEGGCSYSYE